jgi:hypothetical protein
MPGFDITWLISAPGIVITGTSMVAATWFASRSPRSMSIGWITNQPISMSTSHAASSRNTVLMAVRRTVRRT